MTLTLDRAEARNALDAAAIALLAAALEAANADRAVRAVVLQANGPSFSAGGDFSSFRALIADAPPVGGADPIATHNRAYGALLERIRDVDVPTVSVVAGAAVGGGVGLAAVCDIVIATPQASFRLPEVTLGLPPAQVAPFVADRIGRSRALRAMVTGHVIAADEAARIGLVDILATDDAGAARELGDVLAALGRAQPDAVRSTKQILARDRTGERASVLDFAAERFAAALRSGSASEGLAAFAERRPAAWVRPMGAPSQES